MNRYSVKDARWFSRHQNAPESAVHSRVWMSRVTVWIAPVAAYWSEPPAYPIVSPLPWRVEISLEVNHIRIGGDSRRKSRAIMSLRARITQFYPIGDCPARMGVSSARICVGDNIRLNDFRRSIHRFLCGRAAAESASYDTDRPLATGDSCSANRLPSVSSKWSFVDMHTLGTRGSAPNDFQHFRFAE